MSHHHGYLDRQKQRFEDKPSLLVRLIKNPRFPRTMQKKLQLIADTFRGCDCVLEVGTGRGLQLNFLLERFEGTTYVGVDFASNALQEARTSVGDARASFATAAVEALPFEHGAFDGVFCIDVLHHAGSQTAMLAELRRVLKPGGRVLCVEPNPVFPLNVIFLRDPLERKLFDLTRHNATAWAEGAGLVDVRLTNLPVFFPSFPTTLSGTYAGLERVLGSIPGVRRLSTTLALAARRPL